MSPQLRFGLAAIWLVLMAGLALLYTTVPPSPDQSQFDWMAFIATQGGPYYSNSFDMNWPGAMVLHEAGIRVFGIHAWTWRLTDFLIMLSFTFAGARFLARSEWSLAPTLFIFFYPALYVTAGSWMAGQRDIIATGFLLIACLLALPGGRREGIAAVGAGLCVAAAVLVRPPFLSFLAGLMLLEALPMTLHAARRCTRIGRALRFLFGCVLGLAAAVATGFMMGNLDDWFQQSFQFSTSIYVGDPPADWRETLATLFLQSWHWITALALVGAAFWAKRDKFGYAFVLLLGIAATLAVSFAVQNKGFGYHLGGILTVLVLFLCVGLDGLNQMRLKTKERLWRGATTAVLAVAVLLALAGTAKKFTSMSEGVQRLMAGQFGPTDLYGLTESERQSIVAMIQDGSTPDQTVIVYGSSFELAYRAGRMPAYRYFTPAADQITPEFAHSDAWLAEIDAGLKDTPPAFVIIDRKDVGPNPETPAEGQPDKLIQSRLLAHIATGHEVVFANDTVVVYRALP